MRKTLTLLLGTTLVALLPTLLTGCGCGFDCNSNNDNDGGSSASLTLGFSDSLPEDLKQVVIEVDAITFRRSGEDIGINDFTIDGTEVGSFKIDLLQYRGTRQLEVITNKQMPTGTYSAVVIAINDDSLENSFVQKADDTLERLDAPDGGLVLDSIRLGSGPQDFTVEFGLAQALQLTGTSDYSLTANGVRIENNATAAVLSGQIDSDLFDEVSPCDQSDPETGNRLYLYRGTYTSADLLGDVFTTGSTTPPGDAIAPFAVASMEENLAGDWDYSFGYVPAGDYTLAFSCDTADDDSVEYDQLVIPLPDNEIYQIQLSESKTARCNLPGDSASDCTRVD